MLLFSVAVRISKAESRRQKAWPGSPAAWCCCGCVAKHPGKRSGTPLWVGGRQREYSRHRLYEAERLAGDHGTICPVFVQTIPGAGPNCPARQANPPPATEGNSFLTMLVSAQHQGSKGAGAAVSGCWDLHVFKNGKGCAAGQVIVEKKLNYVFTHQIKSSALTNRRNEDCWWKFNLSAFWMCFAKVYNSFNFQ